MDDLLGSLHPTEVDVMPGFRGTVGPEARTGVGVGPVRAAGQWCFTCGNRAGCCGVGGWDWRRREWKVCRVMGASEGGLREEQGT